MKVTRSYLKKIIREELKLAKQQLRESGNWEDLYKTKGEWDIPQSRSTERRFDFPSLVDLQDNGLDGNINRVFLWLYMNGFQYAGYRNKRSSGVELWFYADEKSMNRQNPNPNFVVLQFTGGDARDTFSKLKRVYERPGQRNIKKGFLVGMDGYKLPWMGTDIK